MDSNNFAQLDSENGAGSNAAPARSIKSTFLGGIYHGTVFTGSILAYPFLLFGKRARLDLGQRYGLWGTLPPEVIWLHGASVGEVNGLSPLVPGLRQRFPGTPILITCATSTGLERAKELADVARLLPIDHPFWIKKAIGTCKIRMFIFGETELWPALIRELKNRNVPCILINARISDFSFKRYKKITRVVSSLLGRLNLILATTEPTANRLRELGAAPEKLFVTGNAKYDVAPSITSSEKAAQLKREHFANNAPVLTLASIRPGEEDIWFKAVQSKLKPGMALNVIVAPRHREKFEYFAQQLSAMKFSWTRWSTRQSASDTDGAQFILLDTYGDLERAFSFSDVAFIGGSLVNFGGHNPLEAAAYGCLVCMGPYISNVREVVEDLVGAGAFKAIESDEDASSVVSELITNPESIKRQGECGIAVSQQHRGATNRILQKIEDHYGGSSQSAFRAEAELGATR